MHQRCSWRIGFAAAALMSWPAASNLGAQWRNVPLTEIPKNAAGKPDLTAPAPRTADKHPDFSGMWEQDNTKYVRDIASDLKPADVPFLPAAKAIYDARIDGSHEKEDPDANCLPQGVPKIEAAPAPWRVVQTPGRIVFLYEAFNLWRQVFLDGRELVPDPNPTWMGYSTGKWDGDTLVVETRGFNGKAWLDQLGKPSTDALHVTERYRRPDFGHITKQITIDDPKAYSHPWTVTQGFHLLPGGELLEFICNENNVDVPHLPGNRVR